MQPYNLFLDDERSPSEVYPAGVIPTGAVLDQNGDLKWVVCRSRDEFRWTIVELGLPAFVSFDFHLQEWSEIQDRFLTGLDCAQLLVSLCNRKRSPLPPFNVHSDDSEGIVKIHRFFGSVTQFVKAA
jgi:hypothetical protein